jgi:hypothetical protein
VLGYTRVLTPRSLPLSFSFRSRPCLNSVSLVSLAGAFSLRSFLFLFCTSAEIVDLVDSENFDWEVTSLAHVSALRPSRTEKQARLQAGRQAGLALFLQAESCRVVELAGRSRVTPLQRRKDRYDAERTGAARERRRTDERRSLEFPS